MPKVSFILPAYKRRFLGEAIASILAQTYRDFELVVVDDCSPENLKEVVDEFHDERMTYYRNEQNIGGKDLVAAWTHALEFAHNDWCVLASDDDLYHPEYLQEMVGLVQKYPKVAIVHCRIGYVDSEGRLTRVGRGRSEYESCLQFVNELYVVHANQVMPEFMFRKDALLANGGFVSLPLAWGSDDATWTLLSRVGGCACSSRMLFKFRFSGVNISSKSNNFMQKAIARLRSLHWMEQFVVTVPANTEEEQLIKRTCMNSVKNWYAYGAVRDLAINMRFCEWCRLLCLQDLPRELKWRLLADRVRCCVHPINLSRKVFKRDGR